MPTNIRERLSNWEKIYPEDMHKVEGHLYREALDEILHLDAVIKRMREMLERT